jgi:hypothetical protein
MYRIKFVVNARLQSPPRQALTTTFALGPYGDVVFRGGDRVYLSWYPACLAGISSALEPPAEWWEMITAPAYQSFREDIARKTINALAFRIPALKGALVENIGAGVIVAWGDSDIDQVDSALHRRHDIGVYDHNGYLSVDTGKLTTAPMFAARVHELLEAYRRAL